MVRSCNSCSKTNRSFSSITLLVFHGMRLFYTQLPKFLQCQGCSRSILSGMCPVRTGLHHHPLALPCLDLFILQDLRLMALDLRILNGLEGIASSLFAEFAEKRDGVAEHGVVGAGVLHGAVEFAFDAWYGLEKELTEVAEGGGGLVGDALFG